MTVRNNGLNLLVQLFKEDKLKSDDIYDIVLRSLNDVSFYCRKKAISLLTNDKFLDNTTRDKLLINKLNDRTENEKLKKLIIENYVLCFKTNFKSAAERLVKLLKWKEGMIYLIADLVSKIWEEFDKDTVSKAIDWTDAAILSEENANLMLAEVFHRFCSKGSFVRMETIFDLLKRKKKIHTLLKIINNMLEHPNLTTKLAAEMQNYMIHLVLTQDKNIAEIAIQTICLIAKTDLVTSRIEALLSSNLNFLEKQIETKDKTINPVIIKKSFSIVGLILYNSNQFPNTRAEFKERVLKVARNILDSFPEIRFDNFEPLGYLIVSFPDALSVLEDYLEAMIKDIHLEIHKKFVIDTFYTTFKRIRYEGAFDLSSSPFVMRNLDLFYDYLLVSNESIRVQAARVISLLYELGAIPITITEKVFCLLTDTVPEIRAIGADLLVSCYTKNKNLFHNSLEQGIAHIYLYVWAVNNDECKSGFIAQDGELTSEYFLEFLHHKLKKVANLNIFNNNFIEALKTNIVKSSEELKNVNRYLFFVGLLVDFKYQTKESLEGVINFFRQTYEASCLITKQNYGSKELRFSAIEIVVCLVAEKFLDTRWAREEKSNEVRPITKHGFKFAIRFDSLEKAFKNVLNGKIDQLQLLKEAKEISECDKDEFLAELIKKKTFGFTVLEKEVQETERHFQKKKRSIESIN